MKYTKGDKIKYIGKWFIGFMSSKPYGTFLKYEDSNNAWILYNNDFEMMVRINEIKPA